MTRLAQAPLIEAVFELRWGKPIPIQQNGITGFQIEFSDDDRELFPGQFRAVAQSDGYTDTEKVNAGGEMFPHLATRRYRKAPNSYPVYQTGLGVFAANQINDGYDWTSFKASILNGLQMLDRAYPGGLSQIPPIGLELRYQDGFYLGNIDSSWEFLKKTLAVNIGLPTALFDSPHIADDLANFRVEYQLNLTKPNGILALSVFKALINGQGGFVMDTVVRSTDGNQPTFSHHVISNWLEEAHAIQQHAFTTLINPAYARTLK